MKHSQVVMLILLSLATASLLSAQATSTWVFYGADGQLHYQSRPTGDQIMDFSYAGYGGGGVALPSVPVQQTVSPSGGDDTSAIQSAINSVAALPLDASGFRGAVLLTPGTYQVSGSISIKSSGVVLRGSGSGSGGTVINMVDKGQTLFAISG